MAGVDVCLPASTQFYCLPCGSIPCMHRDSWCRCSCMDWFMYTCIHTYIWWMHLVLYSICTWGWSSSCASRLSLKFWAWQLWRLPKRSPIIFAGHVENTTHNHAAEGEGVKTYKTGGCHGAPREFWQMQGVAWMSHIVLNGVDLKVSKACKWTD